MCGRFKLTIPFSEIVRLYNLTFSGVNLKPRYNIAPSQDVLAVRSHPKTHERTGDVLRWGLIPFWAKDAKIGYSMINAKAETVAEKPAFREAFKSRRCILPADGFYEWQKLGAKANQPYLIQMKDRSLFGFAGLWERWKDKASGETIQSCTIITTEPNELCAPIYNRMPVILDPKNYGAWLGETTASRDELLALLRPYPTEKMEAYKIGPRIGNVKNDDAALIERIATG
jgi:putative SOS response-associated peptidase YedK